MRCATTRTLSRVSVFTRDAGPRTVTDTRSGDKRNPVKPEAAVVIGTPPIERSIGGVTTTAAATVFAGLGSSPPGVARPPRRPAPPADAATGGRLAALARVPPTARPPGRA